MKFFTQTVVDYVSGLVAAELTGEERGELRIFTQSMPPGAVYRIFDGIGDVLDGNSSRVRCEMRVANGLYNQWRERETNLGDIERLLKREWIDTQDRLTHYRNLTRSPDEDLLLVILVGIDCATDRGGLADFYTLTDEVIFRDCMGASYRGWIGKALHEAGLADVTGSGVREFDQFLHTLFEVRPRNLVALSEFLADVLLPQATNCDSASEFLGLAFENLPFWGVPPLFSPANPARRIDRLPTASKVFQRDQFREKRERKKAIERIEAAKVETRVEPQTRPGVAYDDIDDFFETLTEFVERGSQSARGRLLQTDFCVVMDILQRQPKRPSRPKPDRDQTLRGPSLQVMLQGILSSLDDFVSACGRSWPPGQLQGVEVVIESFDFDGTEGEQDSQSATAEEVFRGLIGGLCEFFQDLKIPLGSETEKGDDPMGIPISCTFGHLGRDVEIKSKRLKESRLRFRVIVVGETSGLSVERKFVWVVPPHHEERVRLTCARLMEQELRDSITFLPVVHMQNTLDELYFALDDGEAHRMFASGLGSAKCHNVLDGLPLDAIDRELQRKLADLSSAYYRFVNEVTTRGYFASLDKPLRDLVRTYQAAVDRGLVWHEESQAYADDLLRRLYQAFLCVPEGTSSTSAYLPTVVATGVTPAIAETVQAREVFLRDGFLEVVRSLLEEGRRAGKTQFDRLLGLADMRRPLYGLVFDASRRLTTNLRSFGLLHRLGERPTKAPTLDAQAEMRADDASGSDSLSEYRRGTPESRVITRTLLDYRQVHPYAADRLAIVAANVESLQPLVAGIEAFLQQELGQQNPAIESPYMLSVWIIGRGPSATAAQDVLRRWQESWAEETSRQKRPCRIKLAYRPARNRPEVLDLLKAIDQVHDVGFLFDFLNDQTGGDSIVPVEEFAQDWRPGNIGKFPISEHPRPVRPTDPHLRQALVSNRRFKLAARHAEMTARLKNPEHPGRHHLIFNQVEYGDLERRMTQKMHALVRWVACLDRFVDKTLILDEDTDSGTQRKLVGFTSGVGGYGEFNLTLSTESSTTGELLQGTARQLGLIYRDWHEQDCQVAGQRLVTEAQAVTGLSLVRALGSEGVMRDVIGYAIANCIYLGSSHATLCAAIPLDSFVHWFRGAEYEYVPDLLLLEAYLHGDRLTVEATVVECKVGQRSPTHVEEAVMQAATGVAHLSHLFLPSCVEKRASEFDRRYWWAQLHRALVVRNKQSIQPRDERAVDQALEHLAEGSFDIHWRAIAATFWTDDADQEPDLQRARTVGLLEGGDETPLEVYHASVGHRATLAALKEETTALRERLRPVTAARIVEPASADDEEAPLETEEGLQMDEAVEPEPIPAQRPLTSESVEPEHYAPAGGEPVFVSQGSEVPEASTNADLASPEEPDKATPITTASEIPERFLLGSELDSHGGAGTSVYWEYGDSQLPNRHLLVFGNSGQGKTYAIQALLLEMAKVQQSALVIDYTDGFLPSQLEPELRETADPETYALAAGRKLPLDPFRLQSDEIEGIGRIQEKPFDVAKRVASIFTAVYSSLGEQQRATLVDRIEQGVASGGLSLQALYDQLRDEGQDLLANKLMPLARTEPFTSVDEEAWATLFDRAESRVSILQLARIPKEVQRLIIEFLLWDFWDYLRRTGNKNRPRPVVLDEVQNLDHRSGSPLEKYLREGRKFGATMILATQTMSNFKAEERDRLFQVAHMLFFKPADTELRSFASVLKDRVAGSSLEDWSRQLSSLQKGECLSVGFERGPNGRLRSQVRRIAITSLADRVGVTE